jgi:hypothetical protein
VARIVNAIGLSLRDAHFWGMDEWDENGKTDRRAPAVVWRNAIRSSASTASAPS